MKNFKSYQLAVTVYKNATQIPLPYHLKEQLLRASSSVALNLAEGSAKSSLKDRRRFYQIAFASLRETQCIFELANLTESSSGKLVDVLAAHLYKLCKSLEP